jgi:methionyl-tRNA formyltransferase
MQMVLALDAGPVLFETRTVIPADETAGELTERLAELGATAIIECLALMQLGGISPTPQDAAAVTVAPKISREVARLHFTEPAVQVAREIRAYDPRPGAWATLRDAEVRLFGVRVLPDRAGDAGQVLEIGEMGLIVACGSGAVAIETVHPAGKRRLAALDFAQGRGVALGDYLS